MNHETAIKALKKWINNEEDSLRWAEEKLNKMVAELAEQKARVDTCKSNLVEYKETLAYLEKANEVKV